MPSGKRRALRTPSASARTKPSVSDTVVSVARPWESSDALMVLTTAVPTIAPSEQRAIPAAWSGVVMPKPTQIGRSVWRFRRSTARVTRSVGTSAVPVMPVIDT